MKKIFEYLPLGMIMLTAIALLVWMEKQGSPFALPEDAYYFYRERAEKFNQDAQLSLDLKDYSANISYKKCEKEARRLSEHYREVYNAQLGVRLSRAFAVTGNSEWFWNSYNAQKL